MTNVVLCVLGCGLVLLARQFESETVRFTMGFSGVSGWSVVLYVAALVVVLTQPVDRWTVWIVLAGALAMRAMTLFASPYLSTDIYRYVWDGVVQHAGVNPYRYVPGDGALAWLRPAHAGVFAHINRRDYARTIYPPVAQMVFWLATLVSPTVQAMKLAMFGFECVTVAGLMALLRWLGRPVAEVLVYAWCPLLVWEIAGAGHVDAAVYGFVVLALWMRARERDAWVGFFLGCAVMTKFYPLVLVPALWRRGDWKMPAAMLAVIASGYAVYASVGRMVFGFLGGYVDEEGMDTGERYFLLDWVRHRRGMESVPVWAYMVFCAVVMGAICWWCCRHCSREREAFLRGAMMLGMGMMLLFSPHYPWYVAWLAPLMTLDVEVAALVYVCALFYALTTQWADGTEGNMLFLNEWIYGAVALGMVVGFAMRGRWGLLSARVAGRRPQRNEER